MNLTAQNRTILGKSVKELRKQNLIPAELYGKGISNLHLTVSKKDLAKILKETGENAVINLTIDNESRPVLMHDFQTDPLTDEVMAIDFYQVRMDEKIKVKVPIEFIGVASAVKDKGGILVKSMQEIEVEALPAKIPQSLKADLGLLNDIGESLYVKNLPGSGDFRILIDPETVIASVVAKVTEEQEAALAQQIDVSAVKVETEEKKTEREKAKPESETGTAKSPEAGKSPS